MRYLILTLILALSLSLPVAAVAADSSGDASAQAKKSGQPAGKADEEKKDPAIAQMEVLAKTGIEQALKVVQQSRGFYPFALLLNDAGDVRLIGYQGEAEQRPTADDFAVALFLQLREQVKTDSALIAASVFKPMHIKADDGSNIPGVWSAVDHRNAPSFVMFQPLVQQEPGRYVLGNIIYQKSQEPIFEADAAE